VVKKGWGYYNTFFLLFSVIEIGKRVEKKEMEFKSRYEAQKMVLSIYYWDTTPIMHI